MPVPSLETRVHRLEERLERIEKLLESLAPRIIETAASSAKQSELSALRADVMEIKGRLSQTPTTLILVSSMIATWCAGAGIVGLLLRFLTP